MDNFRTRSVLYHGYIFSRKPEARQGWHVVKKNVKMILYNTLILFGIGMCGIFLNRKNLIISLMSIELMLLAINCNLILLSVYLDDIMGQVFALFVLTVAAAESAIGLAILVVYYRVKGGTNTSIYVDEIHLMKG